MDKCCGFCRGMVRPRGAVSPLPQSRRILVSLYEKSVPAALHNSVMLHTHGGRDGGREEACRPRDHYAFLLWQEVTGQGHTWATRSRIKAYLFGAHGWTRRVASAQLHLALANINHRSVAVPQVCFAY